MQRIINKKNLISFLVVNFFLFQAITSFAEKTPAISPAQKYLEKIANDMWLLEPGDILYDRINNPPHFTDIEQLRTDKKLFQNLVAQNFPDSELINLLEHPDPRVRSLAMASLFIKENPQHLPYFVKMTEDNAETFPKQHTMVFLYSAKMDSIPTVKQTIADLATQMVKFYMEKANYNYGVKKSKNCPGFEDYWKKRKDAEHLANWYFVRMQRATQGTSPAPEGREDKFAAIKEDIEKLDSPERLWYRIFVGTLEGGENVYTRAELLQSANTLGTQNMINILNKIIPISDPDLSQQEKPKGCAGYDWLGGRMAQFVYTNAEAIFLPEDATALLQTKLADVNPYVTIAAARLRPNDAEKILKEKIEIVKKTNLGWDSARLVAALYNFYGKTQLSYIMEWFYTQIVIESVSSSQKIFLQEIANSAVGDKKMLLERIISDPRIDNLDEETTAEIIQIVDQWIPGSVIKDQDIDYFDNKMKVSAWKDLLIESIPRWKINEEESKSP